MIKKIEISNFRSLLSSKIEFTPFTVIVGANASGKSNLIKAIEFISDAIFYGIQEAGDSRGGFSEIVPKQKNDLRNLETKINICFEATRPKNWNDFDLPPLDILYEVTLKRGTNNSIKVVHDEVIFKEVLTLAEYLHQDLERNKDKADIDKLNLAKGYELKFRRNKSGKISVETNIDSNQTNNELLTKWIGINRFVKDKEFKKSSIKELLRLTRLLVNGFVMDHDKSNELILSRKRRIENISKHFERAIRDIALCGKYDLLLNELRVEQNISRTKMLDCSGKNMPTAVRLFQKNKDRWLRVMTTMSNISPYFSSVTNKTLKAGKEYLLFEEIFGGRGIESWEASDGTLRAFAILLALESHPRNTTIMIEEPEHGLHPWALKDLLDHIREVVEKRNLQVIITTHSPQVLENINPDELLIAERTVDKGTRFMKINDIIPGEKINMADIGKLWVKGLLKGVPSF